LSLQFESRRGVRLKLIITFCLVEQPRGSPTVLAGKIIAPALAGGTSISFAINARPAPSVATSESLSF